MNFPEELLYTADHEWVRFEGNTAIVGITDFAQGELGDIVFIEVNTIGSEVAAGAVFGTVEAVKTVSDLFCPVAGTVRELNPALDASPELVNSDPYGQGWIVKVEVADASSREGLMDATAYKALINQ